MSAPINTAVCGALGRMGRMVIRCVLEKPELALSGVLERPGLPTLGQDPGPLLGGEPLGVSLVDDPARAFASARVYIDFTSPEASLRNLAAAVPLGVAAVIGVTGFDEAGRRALARAAEQIPVLWSPNMSAGVNVMYQIAARMAGLLGPDFDLEIVEAHHNQKKDAPSGTALRLLEVLAEARGETPAEVMTAGRQGQTGARTKKEIGVLALRGGDIVGDHTVYFCGPGERLELTHRAGGRETFARGAVRAAGWLVGQKPGLYAMADMLGQG